jgi:hypothetical protein
MVPINFSVKLHLNSKKPDKVGPTFLCHFFSSFGPIAHIFVLNDETFAVATTLNTVHLWRLDDQDELNSNNEPKPCLIEIAQLPLSSPIRQVILSEFSSPLEKTSFAVKSHDSLSAKENSVNKVRKVSELKDWYSNWVKPEGGRQAPDSDKQSMRQTHHSFSVITATGEYHSLTFQLFFNENLKCIVWLPFTFLVKKKEIKLNE